MAAMEDLGSSTTSTASQTFSTNSFFTPLLISMMGIGAAAISILFYHLLLVRYCMRRHAARMAALRNFTGEEIQSGVDEKTLLTIPIITYKRSDSDECECAVCLGDVENGDKVRLLPNCKHVFHVKCIDEWFVGHTSCPVCRVPVVVPDSEIRGGCLVCRSVGAVDDRTSVGSNEFTSESTDSTVSVDVGVIDGPNGPTCLSRAPRITMLRHCNSLSLPREKMGMFTGMELKRSLSMGQSTSVIIDINIENVDKDCKYYSSFRDQSIRQFQRVKESITRICVGQGQGSGILPY